MRRTALAAVLGGLLAAAAAAQPPAGPFPTGRPSPSPGQSVPEVAPGGAGAGLPASGGPKVCVTEMVPTTRVVYGSVCKEYCRPRCGGLWGGLKFWLGWDDDCGLGLPGDRCDGCGAVWSRRVLTKRVVPGPDRPACVLRDAPAGCDAPVIYGLPPGVPPTMGPLPAPVPGK